MSRVYGAGYICSACGEDEAVMNMKGLPLPGPDDWPVDQLRSFLQSG